MESLEEQLDLLKRIVAPNQGTENLPADISRVEKIIKEEIPNALEKQAPANFPELYFDFEYVYSRFYDFLLFDKLIGKNVVALGGSFSSGKSSFLNSLMGKSVLPAKINPSTSVPTYLISGEEPNAFGINEFDAKVTLTLPDIKAIAHGFGASDDEKTNVDGITLGHLLRSLFIATPLVNYKHIAFLDTPGYSKADGASYSARTDAKIAHVQLNSSSHILWFAPAEFGTIKDDDIAFLQNLDRDIPKLIIITKADKAPNPEDLNKVKNNVKSTLDMRGVPYEDVLTFTMRKKFPCDIDAIKDYLNRLDEGQTQADFAHSFKKLFVACRDYYDDSIDSDNLSLSRINQALTLAGDNDDVNGYLSSLAASTKEHITSLKDARENLRKLQQEFFAEIKIVADKVGIKMPEPSEIDLIKGDATDPAAIVNSLLQKRNLSVNPATLESMRRKLADIKPNINNMVGGSNYKETLVAMMKERLG